MGMGGNASGQLGDGTLMDRTTPVQVLGLSKIVQISFQLGRSLALKSDGTVWGWGSNVFGNLGDGTAINRNIPVQALVLKNVVQIAAGFEHSVALKSDGAVWVWGNTQRNQRGGSQGAQGTPKKIPSLVGQTTLGSMSNHTFTSHAIPRDTVTLTSSLKAQYAAPFFFQGNLTLKNTTVALPVKPLAFSVDGTLVGRGNTIASGTAYLKNPTPIPVGSHALKAEYVTSSLFNSSSATATLTIVKADTSLLLSNLSARYGDTPTFNARFKRNSDASNPAGFPVEYSLDGTKIGTVTTNAKGYAPLSYKVEEAMSLGAHTLKVSYAGDANHNPCSLSLVFTIGRAFVTLSQPSVSGKVGEVVTLKATLLRPADNKPLANRKILFYVAGVKVGESMTDSAGVATLSYTITQAIGTYKLRATFGGDTYYLMLRGVLVVAINKRVVLTVNYLHGQRLT